VPRRSALKAQQATWRQIGALLLNAPRGTRNHYRDLPDAKLVAALSNTRPHQIAELDLADPCSAALVPDSPEGFNSCSGARWSSGTAWW
jgi:hypothetical protein